MSAYILRRLLLLPLTLFCIVLVNFIIINLAPGDPVSVTEISQEGTATRSSSRASVFGSDERYLQFREFYGLTLPILLNPWPYTSLEDVQRDITRLTTHKWVPGDQVELGFKELDTLRTTMGDKAKYLMPQLLLTMQDKQLSWDDRELAVKLFVRGGFRQAFLGPNLTVQQKEFNKKIAKENELLLSLAFAKNDTEAEKLQKIAGLQKWYRENRDYYNFEPDSMDKIAILLTQTRFAKYMQRVLTLDFGTLRDDSNKTVLYEVTRRFKYSLTLAILPMIITFVLCIVLGFIMAAWQNRWPDTIVNLICLILYAIPIFVVAPLLIEKVALNNTFPFSNIPIPYSGFNSPEREYANFNSYERLMDILRHIFLPLIAIMYGSLAAQARLSRTAVLEVLRQDYVRTAKAKGVGPGAIMTKHVGRNAAITIVTSIAGSLGIVLGGSLIVETIFDINGFGKFFYEAVVNRDYNVIMFSAFAGSFLTLLGYLVADIAYTFLDPRVTLD